MCLHGDLYVKVNNTLIHNFYQLETAQRISWYIWQLILYVILTGLRDAQISGKYYYWVFMWECFWKRLEFELVYWVEKLILTNVNGHQPICWGSEKNKKAVEGWICSIWAVIFIFSCPQTIILWDLGLLDSDQDLDH